MTPIITYSLRSDASNSDEYYQTIAAFADTWLARAKPKVKDLMDGFQNYRQAHSQPVRSEEECVFELLALGVLIREHGQEAMLTPKWVIFLLHGLALIQGRWSWTEAAAKSMRGCAYGVTRRARGPDSHEDVVNRIIRWLRTNDESAKASRFDQWHAYFLSGEAPIAQTAVAQCLELAEDFAGASQQALGKYTEGVEHFLAEVAPRYRWRYDAGFVSRTRLEYHLGMLGNEVLNRAYRRRFLSARHKVVILPPCMCAPQDGKCKAVETSFGAKCQACTPACRVNQITKLGERDGFEVHMIPDEIRVFGSGNGNENLGLVGVSCALTNWNGGWDADSLGIPAQGVLLDYVGCKFHWDKKGFPTDTNLRRLQEVLGGSRKE